MPLDELASSVLVASAEVDTIQVPNIPSAHEAIMDYVDYDSGSDSEEE